MSNLSRFRYNKSSSASKRKQSSPSSASDIGTSPELKLDSRQKQKKQKQQVGAVQIEEMATPITLEEVYTQLAKLATKEDLQELKEEISKTTDALLKRVDILENRLFEIESEKDKLKKEVNDLKEENASLRNEVDQRRKEGARLRTAQNDHEQHGRSWNVRVYGVKEGRGGEETAETCVQKCLAIFNDKVGVSVTDGDVEVAHRSGKPGGSRPRPILLRFFSRRKKAEVIAARKTLKGSGISISEDLTRSNYQLLSKANNHSATMVAWAANGKILAKLKNGKVLQINIDSDLDQMFARAMG